MARPRKEIDWVLAEKSCSIFCTAEEISSLLNVSADTLDRAIKREYKCGFADYFKKHSAKGRMSLRRKQFEVAMKGNVGMLIWLGKQYLDQKDRQEISGDNSKPMILKYSIEKKK